MDGVPFAVEPRCNLSKKMNRVSQLCLALLLF